VFNVIHPCDLPARDGTGRPHNAKIDSMKKAQHPPWMPAPQYSATLSGLSLNLLVRDVSAAVAFARAVLAAEVVYEDEDFAVFRRPGCEWMVHADHTYLDHPLSTSLAGGVERGVGAELRLYGLDPDAAESAARANGYTVFVPAKDKPHGLREAYLLDPDGYLWVPGVLLPRP